MTDRSQDLFGAHVSTSGGVSKAPARGREIGASWIQIFTKAPQQWSDPEISADEGDAYKVASAEQGILGTVVHASYLLNPASPKRDLFERSVRSLAAELRRCNAIGADYLVVHPGSATDGDRDAGLIRNADGVVRALAEVDSPDGTLLLLEGTSGKGNVLGRDFKELQVMLERIDAAGFRSRVGVCLDTCHMFAAGMDITHAYDAVMTELEETIGRERVLCWHLNDSQGELGSTTDRHAHIGEGHIGEAGFHNLVRDARWDGVPMLLETPKDKDAVAADRMNLARLRDLRNKVVVL